MLYFKSISINAWKSMFYKSFAKPGTFVETELFCLFELHPVIPRAVLRSANSIIPRGKMFEVRYMN